jgi:hypothetical protein
MFSLLKSFIGYPVQSEENISKLAPLFRRFLLKAFRHKSAAASFLHPAQFYFNSSALMVKPFQDS